MNYRKRFNTKKESNCIFLDLYNSRLYLPKVFNFIGTISIETLHRWVKAYEKYGTPDALSPKYKVAKQNEYNTILNEEMRQIFLTFLLHQSQFNYGTIV